jgi:hypothetical protein
MEVRYLGWSGVIVRHADILVGFDPFGSGLTGDGIEAATRTILCLTHGHPDHCGGLQRLLAVSEAATDLVSSPAVVDYIARGGPFPRVRLHSLEDTESVSIGGTRVTAFGWKHLPLLPPGVRPGIAYAAHLLSRPISFMRIGISSLGLPIHAPTLGFHITFADGRGVQNYAEGLHRLTDPREVEAVARTWPADVLMFAVEPEDVDVIPQWLQILHPSTVLLYEAHRPWRELFRLPCVDLNVYAAELSSRFREMRFTALVHPTR